MSAQPLLDPKHLYRVGFDITDQTGDGCCAGVAGDYTMSRARGDGATAASSGDASLSLASGDSVKSAAAGNTASSHSVGYAARSASAGDFAGACVEGDFSMAAVAGDRGAAISRGECSIAMAAGVDCKVMAGERGCFAACYYAPGNVLRILTGYVGENGIKPETLYRIAVDLRGNAFWVEA